MTKQAWTFEKDIKDNTWDAFQKDAKKYLDDQPVAQLLFDKKKVEFHPDSTESSKLIINRDEKKGEVKINSSDYDQKVKGMLTIATKHFGDSISLQNEESMSQWQPSIDHVCAKLSWKQGEVINMMTEKLGFKK